MSKIIIGIIATLALLGGLVWFARPATRGEIGSSAAVQSAGGALIAEETTFDFGTVSMAAGVVSHSFVIKNTGDAPITLKKLYTSCMCTTAELQTAQGSFGPYGMQGHGFIPSINTALNAGEAARVHVVFDPAAHGPAGVGYIARDVVVEESAGAPLVLRFTVRVTP